MHIRFIIALYLVFYTVLQANAAPAPWVVIKCKYSDQPQEPAFDSFITSTNGMAGYWRDVSYGTIAFNGWEIHGWYTLPFTLAQGMAMTRQQSIAACIAAATDVDFSKFQSVIAVVNAQKGDSGSAGGNVFLDSAGWTPSFVAHELGHGINLDHTFDDTGVIYSPGNDNRPGAYGDGWDIMSAMIFGNSDPTFPGSFGRTGPGMNALNLERLGWLPSNRVAAWNGMSQTVTLAALNHPEASGMLMFKVPIDQANPNHYYSIEFRRKTGWDAGIPRDAVIIHERRADGLFYLIRANGGAERLAGQAFHDAINNVAIAILDIDSGSSTATVNVGRDGVWVDFTFVSAPPFFIEDGSFERPFNTLIEGRNAVADTATVYLKGSRSSLQGVPFSIHKAMTLQAVGGPVTIGRNP